MFASCVKAHWVAGNKIFFVYSSCHIFQISRIYQNIHKTNFDVLTRPPRGVHEVLKTIFIQSKERMAIYILITGVLALPR